MKAKNYKFKIIMKPKIFFYLIIAIFAISYFVKIDTGMTCGESPVVRWKFAIYRGECDDETGCHFSKMEENGILEYVGLKKYTVTATTFIPSTRPV